MTPELSADKRILTVHVPMKLQRRGSRKLIIAPDGGNNWPPPRSRRDDTFVKALARAHRWRGMIENGEHQSIAELAKAQGINKSYLSRILRLSLLAPDIKRAILDGRQPKGLKLADFMAPFPVEWDRQRERFGFVQ